MKQLKQLFMHLPLLSDSLAPLTAMRASSLRVVPTTFACECKIRFVVVMKHEYTRKLR
jgi:hypothetical protein